MRKHYQIRIHMMDLGGTDMKAQTRQNYRKRLIQVVDYIYQHIAEDLDVNTLADVALMSPYHFHRIYRQLANETINATVRRLRLQKAASLLIQTEQTIQQIATHVSYGSLEAFSRAFSKQFGESPADYRQTKRSNPISLEPFVAMLPQSTNEVITMFNVEIIETQPIKLLAMAHQGDYLNIGQAFEKVFHYAISHNILNNEIRSIGIYYQDPLSVPKQELRSHAGVSIPGDIDLKDDSELEILNVPGGRCASLLFKGSYAELEKAYAYLFGKWLPESGLEAADFPPVEEYLNDPKSTPPSELLTRVNCFLKD